MTGNQIKSPKLQAQNFGPILEFKFLKCVVGPIKLTWFSRNGPLVTKLEIGDEPSTRSHKHSSENQRLMSESWNGANYWRL